MLFVLLAFDCAARFDGLITGEVAAIVALVLGIIALVPLIQSRTIVP